MGTWKITVTGHGIHDNGRPDDADALTQEFVNKLSANGHDSVTADFGLTDGNGDVVTSRGIGPIPTP